MDMPVSVEGVISIFSTVFGIISDHASVSVLTGAACGSAIFILNMQNVTLFRRACYFFISFFLGGSCAENVTSLLNRGIDKFFTPAPEINKTFTAALTAAIAVRLINIIGDLLLKKIADRK